MKLNSAFLRFSSALFVIGLSIMIDLNKKDCFFGVIVVFEVNYWEVRRRFRLLTFFGAGVWFGFNSVFFRRTWFSFIRTGFRFIKLKVTSAPPVPFFVPEEKFDVYCSHLSSSSFVRSSWNPHSSG